MNQPLRRALIVIDVQNEYVDGNLPIEHPDLQLSLSNIGKAMDSARDIGMPVVAIQQTAPSNSPIFAEGSHGHALHEVVSSRTCAYVISKTLPNAFTDTTLAERLQEWNINTLTVAGYMTQNCVDSTIKHAFHHGYQVEFLHDAAGTLSYQNQSGFISAEEMHRSFCIVLQSRFAAVMSTAEWSQMLSNDGPVIRDSVYQSAQRARRLEMKTLQFLSAQDHDLASIHNWPPYPEEFNNLDYALRKQGWINEFYNKPHAFFYIAKYGQQTIGFSLLAKTSETEAEFRIALHPAHIGKGIGKTITLRTLAEGFTQLNFSRIYLIVRVDNIRAIRLYQSFGFITREKTSQIINNKAVALWVMDIDASRYNESDHIRSFAQTTR